MESRLGHSQMLENTFPILRLLSLYLQFACKVNMFLFPDVQFTFGLPSNVHSPMPEPPSPLADLKWSVLCIALLFGWPCLLTKLEPLVSLVSLGLSYSFSLVSLVSLGSSLHSLKMIMSRALQQHLALCCTSHVKA